jgi:hypothetical protein
LPELKRPQIETIQRLSARWANDIPAGAASAGGMDFEQQKAAKPDPHPLSVGKHDVPNGLYRVEGMDWALEFKGGQVKSAQRVPSDADPADYMTVPGNDAVDPARPRQSGTLTIDAIAARVMCGL